MARTARRYDLYLPLTDNQGELIPGTVFKAVEQRILARFGGLTAQQQKFPLRGIWQGAGQLYLDQVIILTALDFRPKGSSGFIAQLKQAILRDFAQLEILITEQSLRVH
jgi:hypothetical protein